MQPYINPRIQRRKQKKKRVLISFVLTVIFLLGMFVLLISSHRDKISDSTVLSEHTKIIQTKVGEVFQQDDTNSSLEKGVQQALAGSTGTYGVVIKDLSGSSEYRFHDHTVIDTASLYKLWVMAVVYQQIESGKLEKGQILTEDVSTLNDAFQIASDSAELTSGTITLSVDDALEKMITVSDNYAALLLTKTVRLSAIAAFLTDNGLNESEVGVNGENPTSTASDVALFLEKLYNGKFANEIYTQEMIGLLKKQRLNNKLPLHLSDSVVIAHKTGELGAVTHDAGIVYTDKGDYIIVVMSKTTNPSGAEERIAQISRNVYNAYLNR